MTTIQNPPGRSAIAYRCGTHGSFKAQMHAALADVSALASLTTRRDDDPSIALLDSWASVLDVLSFYQERIANEGYLRTATERRSVLELSRAIGYELSSGVAAGTYLAFLLEQIEGAPSSVTIEAGAQAQSIPGQNEQSQTFETVEDVQARIAWNALTPRLSKPQLLEIDGGELYHASGSALPVTELHFSGTSTNLRTGDLLVAVLKNSDGVTEAVVLRALQVVVDHSAARTRATFETISATNGTIASSRSAKVPAGRVVDEPGLDFGVPGALALNDATVRNLILGKDWTDSELSALASMYHWSLKELLIIIERLTQSIAFLEAGEGIFVLRTKTGFFGNNAPYYNSLSKPDTTYPNDWDTSSGWEIWKDPMSELAGYFTEADVYLERTVPNLMNDSWAVFESPAAIGTTYSVFGIREVNDASVVGFGLTSRAAALKLAHVDGSFVGADDKAQRSDLKVRKTSCHVASELLGLAELPIDDLLSEGDTQIELSGMVSDLSAGQLIALTGERADATGVTTAEILTLSSVTHSEGFTTLHLAAGLANSYVRATVTMNANVARATHGETRTEVLGSGDGAKAFQSFILKQTPLTYVSASTSGGSQSTLEVRVNQLLWREVSSLYECAPTDRVYITRRADDGTVSVMFGDGLTGARLPTGTENVTATYRVGIGLAGTVSPGQISLLMTRSLGLKAVTNPVASSGGADAELLDEARLSAPLRVLTIDRIVSLQDFEDFARCFAGISKAQATLLWNGERRIVHITVAGMAGAVVEPTSLLHQNLSAAIESAGHTGQTTQIDSYQPRLFSVTARILVDESHIASEVIAAVSASLQDAFSFEERSFGQAVLKSEVLAVIQDVEGVVAVDLDALYPSTEASALKHALVATRAHWDNGVITPAELLTIHPAGIALTEMI